MASHRAETATLAAQGLPQAPESVAKDTGESLNVGGSARIELEVEVSHTVSLTSFVITDHTQPFEARWL